MLEVLEALVLLDEGVDEPRLEARLVLHTIEKITLSVKQNMSYEKRSHTQACSLIVVAQADELHDEHSGTC